MSLRMLVLVLPILLGCSKSTTTSSSGVAPTAGGENDEAGRKALSQLEDDWAKALEAHDTAFFARVIAPDFIATADSAKTFGRAEVIQDAADTTSQVRDLRDEERQVRIYGGGTVGVVRGLGSWTVEKGERPGRHRGRYTEVWIKRDGSWQAVTGHYSDFPPPASQP
jgi:ketosteroid isomerase-like protein